ncbi:hypothetical protein ACFC0S_17000 [Streptomyces sp. NPDC056084]|uniref:hypothetical protein n=1 Tax=unclassified Streptomyces TaxID=2593676 RepID=UPI0035DA564B
MSWFKIDDGFHCHTKVMEAGTAAVGLYVRCGSWAAQQASDGRVPKSIARTYGTARMIKALIEVGLWHASGHECKTCPEVDANAFLIHQYLERNPSRAEMDAARKAKSERQQRWREGKRAASGSDVDASTSAGRIRHGSNLGTNSHRVGANLKANSMRVGIELASSSGVYQEHPQPEVNPSSQVNRAGMRPVDPRVDASTGRHGDGNPAPARPVPSPSTSYGSTAAASDDRPSGLPDQLAPLKKAIATAGLNGIAWDLRESGWEYTRQAMDRVGIPAMVAYAVNSARLKGQPAGASAWVQGWRSLEAPEPQDGVAYLPAVVGGLAPANRQQQETNDLFDRAMARAKSRMQEEK